MVVSSILVNFHMHELVAFYVVVKNVVPKRTNCASVLLIITTRIEYV